VRGCNKAHPAAAAVHTSTAARAFCCRALSSAASGGLSRTAKRYFELIEAGAHSVAARLTSDPNATLEFIENTPRWKHFGYSILALAVLYSKSHVDNGRYRDPAMLALAVRIGDLLAT
jgi:2-methylisocitrate lyase-like PEP mutase family enzyme